MSVQVIETVPAKEMSTMATGKGTFCFGPYPNRVLTQNFQKQKSMTLIRSNWGR